jgi:hypothetical protein
MPANKSVLREDEPIEFRPVAGQEDEWASTSYVQRSALWEALGLMPVGFLFVIQLILIGLS